MAIQIHPHFKLSEVTRVREHDSLKGVLMDEFKLMRDISRDYTYSCLFQVLSLPSSTPSCIGSALTAPEESTFFTRRWPCLVLLGGDGDHLVQMHWTSSRAASF